MALGLVHRAAERVAGGAQAVHAVRDVTFDLVENRIYGLLGRNGAGKTTLMQLLTGQDFATRGHIEVFGASPVENADVLERVCFIKESQRGLEYRYPSGIPDDVQARADYEVRVILQMGFPGYFLVVSDYIKWAKEQGIRVGPGRGSRPA